MKAQLEGRDLKAYTKNHSVQLQYNRSKGSTLKYPTRSINMSINFKGKCLLISVAYSVISQFGNGHQFWSINSGASIYTTTLPKNNYITSNIVLQQVNLHNNFLSVYMLNFFLNLLLEGIFILKCLPFWRLWLVNRVSFNITQLPIMTSF